MNIGELATIRIFRFDPETDKEPRYQEYLAPYQERTVLDVLRHIHENIDSTFSFRWACTKVYCRSCVVSVNGKPVLSCNDPAQKEMTIEPHPKFEIIKDLVVDFDRPKAWR